ncbi:MAG: hypothetical protein Q9208_005773 [Pyrenodesmia sp. 3 TL-2023]
MDSKRSHPSNSTAAFGIGERSPPCENPSGRILKGLVSARIDAYRAQSQRQGNVGPAYPPSFPRARFERVQTKGDWPSHDANRYHHQHSRTMTLATDASIFPDDRTSTIQHSSKNHDAQSERQAAPKAVRTQNISNLLHMWESRGGSEDLLGAPQTLMAASFPNDPSEAEEPPLRKDDSPRMALTTVEAHVAQSPTQFPQPINTMLSHSRTLLNVEQARESQRYATQSSSSGRYSRTHSMKSVENTELGNGAKKSDVRPVEDADRKLAFKDSVRTHANLDEPPTAASGMRSAGAQNDSDKRIASLYPTDQGSQARDVRLEGGIRAGYSSSDGVNTISRRGRSIVRQGRFAGSSAGRLDDKVQPLHEQRSGSRDWQAYRTNTSRSRDTPRWDNHELSTSTTSSLLPGHHRTRLAHGTFYGGATGFVSNSAGTCPASPSARDRRWWKPAQSEVHVDPASKRGSAEQEHPHGALKHTDSTSSLGYYSYEQSKLGSAELHGASPIARIAGTREHGDHKPTPRAALGFLDAATQTEAADHIRTASASVWTDSESIARRTRRNVYSRVSRPVRLERRLRRPATRRIQVIVTLDGATDWLADARYSTKGRCGSAGGTGIEASTNSGNPSGEYPCCK